MKERNQKGQTATDALNSEIRRYSIMKSSQYPNSIDKRDNSNDDAYERRWIVGQTISPDGTVLNSPGLVQMIKDVEKLRVRPKLSLEKNTRKSSVFTRAHLQAQFEQQIEDVSRYLGRDFTPSEEDLLRLKKEREKKQKVISRFNDMAKNADKKEIIDTNALLEEINTIMSDKKKIAGLSQASKKLEGLSRQDTTHHPPKIDNPYILPEDIEYEFENVYDDFLEDIKTKQDVLESLKLKFKRRNQKEEEEDAYNERVIKSKRRIRRDSKGNQKLPRSDNPDPVFD